MAELKFKILLVGDSNVGKNEIMYKYVYNSIPQCHLSTIGVDFNQKRIKINNYNIILQIWDSTGQEHYKSLSSSFIRGSDGIVFVYDITNSKSFSNLKEWIRDLENYNTNIKYILCGNRVDLEEQRQVATEALKIYGLKMKIPVFEISSKTGYNLDEAFNKLVDLIMENKTGKELIESYGDNNNIKDSLFLSKKKKGLKNKDKPKNNFSNKKKEVYEPINTFKLDTKLDKLNIYINF